MRPRRTDGEDGGSFGWNGFEFEDEGDTRRREAAIIERERVGKGWCRRRIISFQGVPVAFPGFSSWLGLKVERNGVEAGANPRARLLASIESVKSDVL